MTSQGSEPVRPPVVFINLDSALERRQRMEAGLARLNLDAGRIEAVRWSGLSAGRQAELYSDALNARQYHLPLGAGEKGCYASHLLAWSRLLASDAPAMIVLEDDVAFSDDFLPVVDAIMRLDRPWDMIKLIGRTREKVRSERPLAGAVRLVEYRRIPSLAAGYLVSRSGAGKLLATRQPFGRPVDVDLRFWWENDLVVLGVTPSVLSLDDTSLATTVCKPAAGRGVRQRWKKFAMKAQLTLLNAAHNLRRGRLLA